MEQETAEGVWRGSVNGFVQDKQTEGNQQAPGY